MILVTVGSTNHDDLIKSVDKLICNGEIRDKVVCQIGRGKYEPKNCKWFRFDPKIDENYYQKYKTIICVDSAGTLFRNLELGNKIIAVRHPTTKGALDLGQKLSQDGYIYFIERYNGIKELSNMILDYLNSKKLLNKYTVQKLNFSIILKTIRDFK